MKKLLLAGIMLCPLIVCAQSRVDTMMGSYGFKLALQPKSVKTDTLKVKVQREVAKAKLNKKTNKQVVKPKPKKQNKKKPKK